MALPKQTIDGAYEIIEKIGEGGMCQVYKGRHIELGRIAAIKVPKLKLLESPKGLERFLQEGRNVMTLRHPNIVAIYDVHEAGEDSYIAFEYVDGPSFKALVKQGCSIELALNHLASVAEALTEAKKVSVIHRDIKPANILITKKGDVKVADWGLSKALNCSMNLTATGRTVGTPRYMAPEQLFGKGPTPLSDVFSLGIVAYETVVALAKHGDRVAFKKMFLATDDNPPPLDELAPGAPKELVKLVAKMTAKNPKDRPQTPKEVAKALRKCAKIPFKKVSIKEIKRKKRKVKEKRIVRVIFGAAFLILLFVTFLSLYKSRNQHVEEQGARLRSLLLTAPDKVIVRFSGPREGLGKLFYVAPEHLTSRQEEMLLLDNAKVIDKNSSQLETRLSSPLFENAEVIVELPFFAKKVHLSQKALLHGLNKDLAAMKKEQEHRLYGALDSLRLASKKQFSAGLRNVWQKSQETLNEELKRAGVTEDTAQRIEKVKAKVEALPIYAGSYISRQLLFYRRIEALLSDAPQLKLPWSSLKKLSGSGFTAGMIPVKIPGTAIMAFKKMTKPYPCWTLPAGRYEETPVFLAEAKAVKTLRRGWTRQMLPVSKDPEVRVIGPEDINSTVSVKIQTDDPGTLNWPPRGAFLQIGMNMLSHGRQADIQINGLHHLHLLRSAVAGTTNEKNKRSVATMRISPYWLEKEENEIRITVREIPRANPTNSLELWWIALLME